MAPGPRQLFGKFQADRGTHLAAMIAYYALLSFVPLTFIAFSFLGFFGRAKESSSLVRKLGHVFPDSSLSTIAKTVNDIQAHSTALGIIGLLFLVWSSLSLFGALESAFNIVYGRPNRPFLLGKALASLMMVGSLAFLFASLVVGSIGAELLKRYTDLGENAVFANAISIAVSLVGVFVFLASAYVVLTNDDLSLRQVLPGAVAAAAILEATFQLLPAFVRLSKHNPVLQTLSGPAVLLVWLYVMANVIVLGAEVNWNRRSGSPRAAPARPARGGSWRASIRRRARPPSGRAPAG